MRMGKCGFYLKKRGNSLKVNLLGIPDKITINNGHTNSAGTYRMEQLQIGDGYVLTDDQAQDLISAMAGRILPTTEQDANDALIQGIGAIWAFDPSMI